MSKLTITGNVIAKEDQIDFVKAELEKLIAPTRAEEGCLQYDLHQDNEDPKYFMFYENWQNRDLWQTHMNNAHLKAFQDATDGKLEKFWVHELTHIG
ncbi:MAG: putative quinol monooxygenase [Pseudomonadota bacterium]